MTFRELDVRPLLAKGEEPLSAIRSKLTQLDPKEGLAITSPFLPSPLIEKLRSEGYSSRVERLSSGAWTSFFWRKEAS